MKRSLKNKTNTTVPLHWGEAAPERSIDIDLYLANPSAYGRSNSRARVIATGSSARRRVERPRSKGQALLIIALMMTMLVLFVGLGVDVGNLMGKRAKLQSAVDASALSAAQLLTDGVVTTTVQTKAYQMLEANGILSNTLASKTVDVNIDLRQVRVQAVQHVDTFFMRIVPLWRIVDVSAEATADLNAFAEMNIKPYGQPGVVNELMLQTWGPYSWRGGGDVYSPENNPAAGPGVLNDEHDSQPYGYLFRIDVPPGFEDDKLSLQIFDPDTYNRQDNMPTPTFTPLPPTCSPLPCTPPPTAIPPTPAAYDSSYFWCAQSLITVPGSCTGNDTTYDNPALRLDGYRTPTAWVQAPWSYGRAAVWRVDEYRRLYTDPNINPNGNELQPSWPTQTNFTLWHFDPRITSAFGDPATLSDQFVNGTPVPVRSKYISRGETDMNGNFTDLAWIEPWAPIVLTDPSCGGDCFQRESDGSIYFYLYVQTDLGSSENDYDLRVGPVSQNYANGYNCRTISARWSTSYNNICYSNEQFYRQNKNTLADWDDGGARIFAKRALPINLATGGSFPMLYTQVSQKAAGQTLAVKHFDQDCTSPSRPCGSASTYQMQVCVNVNTTTPCDSPNCEPCSSLLNSACFRDITNGIAYRGPDNGWYCSTCPQPEKVNIPVEGTGQYSLFFGPGGNLGSCSTSWLRLASNLSYSNDTTVWEMPYKRPRLIK